MLRFCEISSTLFKYYYKLRTRWHRKRMFSLQKQIVHIIFICKRLSSSGYEITSYYSIVFSLHSVNSIKIGLAPHCFYAGSLPHIHINRNKKTDFKLLVN
ncbi:unnamed protein product [Spodoptera exigua]|nr:unnamed protein product [Spodoptera exigua]